MPDDAVAAVAAAVTVTVTRTMGGMVLEASTVDVSSHPLGSAGRWYGGIYQIRRWQAHTCQKGRVGRGGEGVLCTSD